jgi:hypothetical protein
MNRINSIITIFGEMPCRGSHQQESATMTTTTSRRAILAGAAALAAVPAITATAGYSPDPIFAVIEAHKAAFRNYLQTSAVHFADEEDKVAEAAGLEARSDCNDVAMNLVDIEPTTMAGVVALIDYVDSFNRGDFTFEDMKSSVCEWPGGMLVDEETYDEAGAEGGELGFAFAVLLNVRDALAGLAVQS